MIIRVEQGKTPDILTYMADSTSEYLKSTILSIIECAWTAFDEECALRLMDGVSKHD